MDVGRAITAAMQEQRAADLASIHLHYWLPRVLVGLMLDVEWHVIDRRYGIWCAQCLLPSAIEADMVLVASRTLTALKRATYRACPDCGQVTT